MFKTAVCIIICLMSSVSCLAKTLDLSAKSAILVNCDNGNAIYEKNADAVLPMASTTKIMTAICTIENINTNMPVVISSDAAGVEGSSVYLKSGEVMLVKELLYAMMLNSGNDAATALAIAVSGSINDFCALMNKTAKRIGAHKTNFTNPSGLYDDEHFTTARDLAKISRYAMKNPLFKEIVSTKNIRISGNSDIKYRHLKNHNRLLWDYEGCVGVKTGFTKKCGRCLVSSAEKGDTAFVAVSLNAPDDWNDHKKMLDYGLSDG